MNLQETAALLGICASMDNRKVGDADVISWQRVLREISYRDAEEAVYEFFGRETDWIKPGHVKAEVHRIRRGRVGDSDVLDKTFKFDGDPDNTRDYIAQWQAHVKSISDGNAPEMPKQLPRPFDRRLLDSVFKRPQIEAGPTEPQSGVPMSPREAALRRKRQEAEILDAELVEDGEE